MRHAWPRARGWRTRRAIHRGDPPAAFEAERVDWIPLDRVPWLIAGGQIRSAVTAAALMLLRDHRPGDT